MKKRGRKCEKCADLRRRKPRALPSLGVDGSVHAPTVKFTKRRGRPRLPTRLYIMQPLRSLSPSLPPPHPFALPHLYKLPSPPCAACAPSGSAVRRPWACRLPPPAWVRPRRWKKLAPDPPGPPSGPRRLRSRSRPRSRQAGQRQYTLMAPLPWRLGAPGPGGAGPPAPSLSADALRPEAGRQKGRGWG